VLLTRGASPASPATYERIFKACQAIVMAANEGERLHGALRLELEKCISALAQEIAGSKAQGVAWLEVLNEAADWFQQRVVRGRWQ
jgi:cullin-4